jgi:hypothetical protein
VKHFQFASFLLKISDKNQALSLALPFALRRARTLRPLAVLILLRKPCTLLRWRFLG